jgi:hypothetical protein
MVLASVEVPARVLRRAGDEPLHGGAHIADRAADQWKTRFL